MTKVQLMVGIVVVLCALARLAHADVGDACEGVIHVVYVDGSPVSSSLVCEPNGCTVPCTQQPAWYFPSYTICWCGPPFDYGCVTAYYETPTGMQSDCDYPYRCDGETECDLWSTAPPSGDGVQTGRCACN